MVIQYYCRCAILLSFTCGVRGRLSEGVYNYTSNLIEISPATRCSFHTKDMIVENKTIITLYSSSQGFPPLNLFFCFLCSANFRRSSSSSASAVLTWFSASRSWKIPPHFFCDTLTWMTSSRLFVAESTRASVALRTWFPAI